MSIERSGQLPFQAHIQLLQVFLAHRDQAVERIQGLLNAGQMPSGYHADRGQLARQFEDCFFAGAAAAAAMSALRGQLQQAHWAEGFRPRDMPGIPNEMFDPADMMARAFTLWRSTRWPGRNGRVRFAQTLFNLYVVRCLALLAMRSWDGTGEEASARLGQVQQLLGALWRSAPPDQPVLVRDARWLIPVAQSPTTDDLGAYFRVAEKMAGSLAEADRLEVHRASVVMAGGHLRSQLRYFNMQGTPLSDHDLLLSTRRSNALDCAMTIQALVPLLSAYERAIGSGDDAQREQLAGTICQAISPDPDLYLNRPGLLQAYSMIEHLFVSIDAGGGATLTAMGQRHQRLVQEYLGLVARVAQPLAMDCPRFRPRPGAYSPYGVMFGFSSNLLEHMAMKALQPDAEARFSLEDVFAEGQDGADRLAWVVGWRRLPHISAEVLKQYEYPQQFAEGIFERLVQALDARVKASHPATGRLFIFEGGPAGGPGRQDIPELAAKYVHASDPQWVAAGRARASDASKLLADRNEGEFIVSWQSPGGWVALSKDILTDVLGAGQDARVTGLPPGASAVPALLCAGLVATP